MEINNKEYSHVEQIISSLFGISIEELYSGKGNIPFKRAMARNLCLYLLHDRYSIFYRQLADRTGLTTRSVMRCVRKARIYTGSDKEYMKYYGILLRKLSINDRIW